MKNKQLSPLKFYEEASDIEKEAWEKILFNVDIPPCPDKNKFTVAYHEKNKSKQTLTFAYFNTIEEADKFKEEI